MESTKEFEDKVRLIYSLITDNKNNQEDDISIIDNKTKDLIRKFKLAQNYILDNLIFIENEKNIKKTYIIDLKKKPELKGQLALFENELKVLDVRERVFRKLADSIVWKLIGFEHYIARNFYIGEKEQPTLLSTGITEVVKKAHNININDEEFALICDITSFVQIGDLLHFNLRDKLFTFHEIKTGKINDYALELLKKYDFSDESIFDSLNIDSKLKKQIKRIQSQKKRAENRFEIIKNEGGYDHEKGFNRNVIDNVIFESFNSLFSDYPSLFGEEDFSYRIINYGFVDTILHVGIYKGSYLKKGEYVLFDYVSEKTKNNFLFKFTDSLSVPIAIPIFLLDIPESLIFDLITGRVTIYFALDLDEFIKLINEIGGHARWLSTKETHPVKETLSKKITMPFFNNKAIAIKNDKNSKEFILGDGALTRIVCDLIDPLSVAQALVS